MKIAEIRDVLRFAEYCRHDYSGYTTDEFMKADVEGKLTARITEMQALKISRRFESDNLFRAAEIRRCEETIARWKELRANPPTETAARGPAGPHRCVFLGGFKCITCGAPFRPKASATGYVKQGFDVESAKTLAQQDEQPTATILQFPTRAN